MQQYGDGQSRGLWHRVLKGISESLTTPEDAPGAGELDRRADVPELLDLGIDSYQRRLGIGKLLESGVPRSRIPDLVALWGRTLDTSASRELVIDFGRRGLSMDEISYVIGMPRETVQWFLTTKIQGNTYLDA